MKREETEALTWVATFPATSPSGIALSLVQLKDRIEKLEKVVALESAANACALDQITLLTERIATLEEK